MRWQLGQFFAFVSLLVLMVFMITGWAGSPEYSYFCSGISGLLLGLYLLWLGRNPSPPAERFRLLRGMRKRRDEKKATRGKSTESEQSS